LRVEGFRVEGFKAGAPYLAWTPKKNGALGLVGWRVLLGLDLDVRPGLLLQKPNILPSKE
jgi:hypothetical protein